MSPIYLPICLFLILYILINESIIFTNLIIKGVDMITEIFKEERKLVFLIMIVYFIGCLVGH